MIIETQVLQEKCKKILDAIGAKKGINADTLELEVANNALYMNVTDKRYFVSVKIPLAEPEEFHAVVDAQLFLSLITKITTKETAMKTSDKVLQIRGNGNYRLPLIYEGDHLVELPRIELENVTSEFNIKNSILQSITKYNGKILSVAGNNCKLPFFYVDNEGAVTIHRNACLNSFELEQPVSLLLSETLVKLFKLFKGENVKFTMSLDSRADGAIQQKVMFFDGDVMLTSILLTDQNVIKTFPVNAIRARAAKTAPYSIVIDKDLLVSAVERVSLFKDNLERSIFMDFQADSVTVLDSHKASMEDIDYINNCPTLPEEGYTAKFNVDDVLLILDSLDDEYLNISFGDKALTITRDNLIYLVPECK